MQIIGGYKYLYWEFFIVWEWSKIERLKIESNNDEKDTDKDDDKSDKAAMRLTTKVRRSVILIGLAEM